MQKEWAEMASNYLKAELSRRGISYEQLREKLAVIGIDETSNGLNVKINRGTFSFAFALQVMKAIGAKTLRIDD